MHVGTVVDATLIAAPTSTKNQFCLRNTAYCEIQENLNWFYILFASANLVVSFRAGRTKTAVWNNVSIFEGIYFKIVK